MRSFKESKFHILDDLKAHHHNFALFSQTVTVYMIEILLADLNMQLKIGINQSLI